MKVSVDGLYHIILHKQNPKDVRDCWGIDIWSISLITKLLKV